MAGHSHWAGIKHKKAIIDNKRGKLWSKVAKMIILAARAGGGDPVTNLTLRYAIDEAKAANMPKDTITRAIKKGTGELEGGNLESCIYEGYGPGGTAVLCEILTDNRNRTAPEIRKIFELHGGNLGSTNCVAWMFETKGLFLVPQAKADEDTLMNLVLESGGDDVKRAGENFEITCAPDQYQALREALNAANVAVEHAELTRLPKNTVKVDDLDDAQRVLALIEKLDDHDDVQNAYANFDIPEEALAQLAGNE